MAKIKIKDLKLKKVLSKKESRKVSGGGRKMILGRIALGRKRPYYEGW